jgi:hypothetical protein
VYLDYATQYNVNNNIFLGLGGGTGIVTTSNTFGGNILGNRMNSLDTMLNDVSGLATAMNPDTSLVQWNMTSVLNLTKTLQISGSSSIQISGTGVLNDITAAGPRFKKLRLDNGTTQTSANVALSAGWGTSPTKAIIGTDSMFNVTVTAGSGTPTANPSVTVTFADGAWSGGNPFCFTNRADGLNPLGQNVMATTLGTTVTLTFVGTPVASTVYQIMVLCGGQ